MASGGERFRFRLPQADAPQFLRRAGWEIAASLDGQALRERYLAGTALADTQITDSAFVIEAERPDGQAKTPPSCRPAAEAGT